MNRNCPSFRQRHQSVNRQDRSFAHRARESRDCLRTADDEKRRREHRAYAGIRRVTIVRNGLDQWAYAGWARQRGRDGHAESIRECRLREHREWIRFVPSPPFLGGIHLQVVELTRNGRRVRRSRAVEAVAWWTCSF